MNIEPYDIAILLAVVIPLAIIILGKVKKALHIVILIGIMAVAVMTKMFGLI